MVVFLFATCFSKVAYSENTTIVSGLTEPIYDIIISAEVSGIISSISFKEGEKVKKGQIILELDKSIEALDVKRTKLIWDSKIELTSAVERRKALKEIYLSTKELVEKTHSVSKEELTQKELEFILAAAEHERLKIAENRERIEYKIALEKMKRKMIKSTINGTIVKLNYDEGESYESPQPLVHIVDTSRCRLICNIEADLVHYVKQGQTVDLIIPSGTNEIKVKGKIIFVSSVVDPASGLMTVKVEFKNTNNAIKPGVTGRMIITTK